MIKGTKRTMKVKGLLMTKEYVWHQNKDFVGGALATLLLKGPVTFSLKIENINQ